MANDDCTGALRRGQHCSRVWLVVLRGLDAQAVARWRRVCRWTHDLVRTHARTIWELLARQAGYLGAPAPPHRHPGHIDLDRYWYPTVAAEAPRLSIDSAFAVFAEMRLACMEWPLSTPAELTHAAGILRAARRLVDDDDPPAVAATGQQTAATTTTTTTYAALCLRELARVPPHRDFGRVVKPLLLSASQGLSSPRFGDEHHLSVLIEEAPTVSPVSSPPKASFHLSTLTAGGSYAKGPAGRSVALQVVVVLPDRRLLRYQGASRTAPYDGELSVLISTDLWQLLVQHRLAQHDAKDPAHLRIRYGLLVLCRLVEQGGLPFALEPFQSARRTNSAKRARMTTTFDSFE